MKLSYSQVQKTIFLCLFCTLSILQLSAQEICNNGIDDDNDGLIDLNDDECLCSDLMASSLIPNPSFEEMTCCPMNEAQLNCAVGWSQASTPTTDYVHTCGVLGNPFLTFEAPLPFPDGEGAIGFRDGKPGQPNFKEYAGACLTQVMTMGTEYRLDFFVGFHDDPASLTFDMAVFGSTSCGELPFGGFDENFGCPTNGPGWVELGAMTVTGENEWKNVIFNFTADQNYAAIVLGPACATNPNFANDPYFFFDRLVLAESIMFEVPLAEVTGSICQDNLILTSSDAMGGEFQWYQDGIAIAGETNQSLSLTNEPGVDGVYEVVITTPTGCFDGEEYTLTVPSYSATVDEEFCEGGSIIIGGQTFTDEGTYDIELISSDGCDSLITLNLTTTETMSETVSFLGCEGESIVVNNETYNTAGTFTQNLTSVDGCDSILTIQYSLSANSNTNLELVICEGVGEVINGILYDTAGQFSQLLSNSVGCDSTLNINVLADNPLQGNLSFDVCEGSSVSVNGESYSQAGAYTQLLTTSIGCDSILTINIESLPNSSASQSYTICEGEVIDLNGQSYNQAGTFTQNLTNASGCDSLLNISIEVLPNSTSSEQYGICDTDVITVNGQSYTDAGSYTQILLGSNGCDSILTVNVFLQEVCSDCIFFEEFNTGSIVVGKLAEDHLIVNLVQNETVLMSLEMSNDEFLQFSVFYLVDNEIVNNGKPSNFEELSREPDYIKSTIKNCNWKRNMEFSNQQIVAFLPITPDELPVEINDKKLSQLLSRIINQSDELHIGAKMKINFR